MHAQTIPVLIGLASGLAIQLVAIYVRWALERSERDAELRAEHREVIAVIRSEVDHIRGQLAELAERVDELPCGRHHCAQQELS